MSSPNGSFPISTRKIKETIRNSKQFPNNYYKNSPFN